MTLHVFVLQKGLLYEASSDVIVLKINRLINKKEVKRLGRHRGDARPWI
jgi:hypothetical protein